MQAIDILKAIAQASTGTDAVLRPGMVRFQLELSDAGDWAGLRERINSLLASDRFSLEPLDELLPRFAVLQFPGVRRTIAPDRLFEMADALVHELGIVSCTPDIGSTLYAEPDARLLQDRTPESAVLDLVCWSDAAAPGDPHWSVKAVKATEAWAISPRRGEGVLVAQPDTGVAEHVELGAGALRLDLSWDVIGGDRDPTDPLDAKVPNPGHGTATGSVVVSRSAGRMVGTAPMASLVPIRCTEDVKIFDGTPVAAAILHAVRVKADVITMSLGGIFSRSISAAIELAVKADVIVMAAAGNCVGFVVYPASDDRVIAVAGVDANDRPWKGTSAGPSVDVSAPAENVYVARRTPNDGGRGEVSGGQGTSFAVATTAGVAALWLAHFGREQVREEAGRRKIPVQELFRAALTSTARKPPRWNSWLHGSGIVDAHALLELPLASIDAGGRVPVRPSDVPEAPESVAVAQVFEDAQSAGMAGDWARFGAEATYLASDFSRRSRAGGGTFLEAAAPPLPSPGIAAANLPSLERSLPSRMAAPTVLGTRSDGSAARTFAEPATTGRSGGAGARFESTMRNSGLFAEGAVDKAAIQRLQDQAAMAFGRLDDVTADPRAMAARRAIVERTDEVVRRLATGGRDSLGDQDRFVLEALVRLKGRPSFKVNDGRLDLSGTEVSDWSGLLQAAEPFIADLTSRVGRIDLQGVHQGTGFVVGAGLVMTNRHVAEAIADVLSVDGQPQRWFLRDDVTINFDDRGRGDSKRFKVREILGSGLDPIGGRVVFRHLDMALLDIETVNDAGQSLPGPHGIDGSTDAMARQSDIAVVGYPARPNEGSLLDPSGKVSPEEMGRRLAMIFGLDYGRKYFSPGALVRTIGELDGDVSKWIVSHDATTLGGNSGSGIVRFLDGLPVVGLHFAGQPMTANFAHALGAVRRSGSLPANLLARMSWLGGP